ncbi:MAG: FkbM family methyltransferase [Thermoleophilia bacterium]|nr:FkbM family methyltransferase [Actinomycetota bacterium]
MAPRNLRHAADRLARASGLSAHEDRRLIRAAYAGILGRDPGDAEVAHWQAQLAEGMTWERFITLMRTAPEFAGGQLKAIAALNGAVEVSLLGGAPVGGMRLRFRAAASDSVVLPSLLDNNGWWEHHVTRALMAIVRPGDVVVDGGANAGYMTVVGGALAGPTGAVIGFEPAADPRAWCEANLALNGIDHGSVLPLGLWDEPATLQIRVVDGATTAAHLVTDPSLPLSDNEVAVDDVPCTSLDALADEGRLDADRLRLVKLVVQGSEPRALRGMRDIAARNPPYVICHVNQRCLAQLGHTCADIATEFDSLGYRMTVLPKERQQQWFAHLPGAAEFPELGLRTVDDLPALVANLPAADDPIEILAIPA